MLVGSGVRFVDELTGGKLGVEAALFEKGVMGSFLNDPSPVDDDDAVGVPDRAEAVSDHQRGPAFHESFEGLLHKRLGLGVE